MKNDVKRIAHGFKVKKGHEPGKRFHWLADVINERGYLGGAEIGCAGGRTTGYVLQNCPKVFLYAVDLWKPVPPEIGGGRQYWDWKFDCIWNKFRRTIKLYKNRIIILRGISWEMADSVPDNLLDFIFIDADHEYNSVIKDIKAWTPKLKLGGMISGHDTHFEGVMQAITELIPAYKAVGIDHCWEARKEDVYV